MFNKYCTNFMKIKNNFNHLLNMFAFLLAQMYFNITSYGYLFIYLFISIFQYLTSLGFDLP